MENIAVGVQGEPGASSFVAVERMFGVEALPVCFLTFEDAHDALVAEEVDAILVENTCGEASDALCDRLLRDKNSRIAGEFEMQVNHCLLAREGVALHEIRTVVSHPQALAQCRSFISNIRAQRTPWHDAAAAAKALGRGNIPNSNCTAVIAGERAAKLYGLKVIGTEIQDVCNTTRFLLIKQEEESGGPCRVVLASATNPDMKTTLAFAAESDHQAGALAKCLQIFCLHDINVLKLESRPVPADILETCDAANDLTAPSRVVFFADLQGGLTDLRVDQALGHLKDLCPFVKVVGSYPRHKACEAPRNAPDKGSDETAIATPGFRVGILGFGTFGQFLAKRFVFRGIRVYATSRSNYEKMSQQMGVEFRKDEDVEWLVSNNLNILIVACSIKSFASVIKKIPTTRLDDCVIVDVLSVKAFPKAELLQLEPQNFGILCTHPFFGPESGRGAWTGLPFMFDSVRILNKKQESNATQLLQFFKNEGCRCIDMSCDAHDSATAETQFLTHLTGRLLAHQACRSSPMATTGYKALLSVMETTCKDSWDLFEGLYDYNFKSEAQLGIYEQSLKELAWRLRSRKANVSRAVQRMKPASTTTMLSKALNLQQKGKDVKILSVGQPNYMPPTFVRESIKQAAENPAVYRYSSNEGDHELRCLIASRYNDKAGGREIYTPDNVILTASLKLGFFQLFTALLDPGCEVLIPSPAWGSYAAQVELVGGKAVTVSVDLLDTQSYPTADLLRAHLTDRTRMIILCSPSNPTGVKIPTTEVVKIVEWLQKETRNVLLVVDEIYDELAYDAPTFFDGSRLGDRFIIGNGFSKSLALCGLRLGYILTTSREVRAALLTVTSQTISCVTSLAVAAATAALQRPVETKMWLDGCRSELRRNAEVLVEALKGKVQMTRPDGAFYVMLFVAPLLPAYSSAGTPISCSADLAAALLEESSVAVVSCEDFGSGGWLRVSYATDGENLRIGANRLAAFLGGLRRQEATPPLQQ